MANRTYNALSSRNVYQERQSQPPIVDFSDFPEPQGGVDFSDFPEEEQDTRPPNWEDDLVLPEEPKNPYAPTYENLPWLDPKNNDPFKPKSYDMLGTNLANEPPEQESLSGSMYGDSSFNYKPEPAFGVKPGNFEGIQSTNPDDYEMSDPEFSLRDLFTAENAIRSSGPILGGIIGGAVGGGTGLLGGPAAPGTVPLGMKVGQSVGSGVGTLITDPLANWYAGKPQDWRSTLFETGVNAAVGPLGKGLQGTSARKILANAVEQATIGGAEGLINAPARKMIRDRAIWDKTGNLNLPSANEWMGAGTTGMTVGGGFGLAHGLGARGYQAYRAARNPLFTGNIPGGAKTVTGQAPPPPPFSGGTPFDDTPTYTYNGPESNQLGPGPKGADEVITLTAPDMASIQSWRDQGYVAVDRSPEGHFRMARADVADKYITPVPETGNVDLQFQAPKTGDPNLNQGQGDPELAGSTPYGEAPQRNVLEGEILPAPTEPVTPPVTEQPPIVGETRTIETALDRRIKQFAHLEGDVRFINQLEDFLGRPPTDEDINASGPFVGADPRSDFFQKRQRMMDQTAASERERANRPFNQEEADKRATWERQNHNMAVYEGRTDPVIKASYDKMQAVKDDYSRWFSQQENQLPEGQLFKPPPEVEEAYKAQIERMEDEHQAVINSRGGFEQAPPPTIQGEVVPPASQVGPTVQLPPGFTPPPVQSPLVLDMKARMKYLDGRKAPDASYKALASKFDASPLRAGETWRNRLKAGIAGVIASPSEQIDSTLGALGVTGERRPAHNQGDAAWEETPDDAVRNGPVGIVQPTLRHPTAIQWDARMRELDAAGAPDHAYREIASTLSRKTLKKGETWRGEIQKAIQYFESTMPPNTSESSVLGLREQNTLGNVAEPKMGPMEPFTQGDLGLNQRTVKRAEKALKPSVPTAPETELPPSDMTQQEIPFPVGPQQENGPGNAAVNKAYLEFIQQNGREPTDDELVNITWGADSEKNVFPGIGPATPTGMMAGIPIDLSSYGPKGQEYIQWLKNTGSIWNPNEMDVTQRIEFDQFVKSLDWEEDPNKMPAVRPEDVNNAVRDTTMSDAQVQNWTGPLFPMDERNVGRTEPLPPEVPIPPIAKIEAAVTDISELELPDDTPVTDATKVIIRSAMDKINETKTIKETLAIQNQMDDDTDLAVEQGDRDSAEIYSALAHYAAQRTVKMSDESIAKLNLDQDVTNRLDNDQKVLFRSAMDKMDAASTPEEALDDYNKMISMADNLRTSHPRLSHVARRLANYAAVKHNELEHIFRGASAEFTPRVSIAKSGEQQDLPEMGLQEKKPFDIPEAIAKWEDAQDVPGFYKLGDRKKIVDTETGMTEEDLVDQRAIIHNMQQDAIHGITEGDFTPEFMEKFPHLVGQFHRIIGWNPGAVSVDLKNGRHVIVDRDAITATLPSERSHVSHKGVMNPTRFDKNGKFIGSASKEVDWSDFPDQEPLPLSSDYGLGQKKMGPGAMTRDEGSSMDLWNQLAEKLGRQPTGEEYLAEIYKEDMSKAPRTLEGKRERGKAIERTMRSEFKEAGTAGTTDFILSSGTRLSKPSRLIHAQALRDIGLRHDEVLRSGVIRVNGGSAETRGPITEKQAREIINIRIQRKDVVGYMDVVLPDGETVGKVHDDRETPASLRTWVNSHFPNEGMMRGEQQILPGFRESDIKRKDVEDPDVELFDAPPNQLKLPFPHPIVEAFREKFKTTDSYRMTRFILPDGERLTFPGGLMHREAASEAGFNLQEAEKTGIMRFRHGSASMSAPMTIAQARHLIDARQELGTGDIPVDVVLPDYGMESKSFSVHAKASTIYNWVNKLFRDFEAGWNEKGDSSVGAIFGGMPFGRAARGARRAARGWGWGQGGVNPASRTNPPATPPVAPAPYSELDEALQVPRHAMTAGDVSFLKRQAAGMITRPEYWKAAMEIPQLMRQGGWDAIDQRNRASIIYQNPLGAPTRAHPQGQPLPSLADDMGIQLYTLASSNQIGPRAQAVASRWLEELPGPVGKMYRVSSRMHTGFLNTLKTNVAENMARNLVAMSGNAIQRITQQGGGTTTIRPGLRKQEVTAQEAFELNPFANPVFAREIGDWINTATGQGPLKTHIVWHKDYESNLENYANALNRTMFASGLTASHVRMLNPGTYVMASPFVRKQYMRSALGQAAAWFGSMLVNKLAADALGIDNEISFNVTSSDFGKNRMGNVRLDPGQGLLQFLVLYGRHWYGGHTTASSDEFKRFGEEYRGDTHGFNFFRFMNNKTEPILKFATDLATADKNNPFHVGDRIIQLAVPLFAQDVWEIAKEEPWLLVPFGIQAAIGDGTQIYERNESRAKFIPKEYDYVYEGNEGLQKIMPWNWFEKDPNQLPEPYKGKWR